MMTRLLTLVFFGCAIALLVGANCDDVRTQARAAGPSAEASQLLGAPTAHAYSNADLRQKLITTRSVIFGDRKEYWADDEAGQFLIALQPVTNAPGSSPATAPAAAPVAAPEPAANQTTMKPTVASTGPGQIPEEGFGGSDEASALARAAAPIAKKMVASLARVSAGQTSPVERAELALPRYAKFHLPLRVEALPVGDYRLTAWLEDDAGARGPEATWDFKKSDRRFVGAATFPNEGLPITIEPISDTRTLALPMELSIPLPRGLIKDVSELAIMRGNQLVPAQITALVKWEPGQSIRWAQAKFIAAYQNGQSENYRLVRKNAGFSGKIEPRVRVTQSNDEITVDNGRLRFTVSKKKFAGIQRAWFDPAGAGKYDLKAPVIEARPDDSGPYLTDGRLVKFTSAADANTSVTIEDAGPESVTILATGWYTDALKRVPPLCQYQIRMTLGAEQSQVQIAHHTIITFDTRKHLIRDLGFAINTSKSTNYAFGLDGGAVTGKLPQTAPIPPRRAGEQTQYAAVFMHQQTWERAVVTDESDKTIEGKKSDGWVATWGDAAGDKPVVSVTLRDIWEKFPKELQARAEAIVVHTWPHNGKRVFKVEDELSLKNIYKFWCFHQHRVLDFNLPQDYFEVLDNLSATETRETKAEHALNGNAQGMTLSSHLTVHVQSAVRDDDAKASRLSGQCLADAKLFELRPFATLAPQWHAATAAVEPMAALNLEFKAFEDAILNGLMSYNATVEHGQEYGMFIWPDTHTYWLVEENRASLHRCWQNSHYHQVGNSWVLWFRSGDPRLLRWARDNSAHFRDVSTIAYAEPQSPETAIRFHLPGAIYHCKGCTPWGSEAQGMIRHDTHAGLYGHWVDANAHLWAWVIGGEPRARDLYQLWLTSLKQYGYMGTGVRREANTTLSIVISAYEVTGDADFLPAIWSLGQSLRTAEPLEKQNPGPLWHPLWMNRYYQLTRDPEYVPFILKYARNTQMGNTWTLALAALAYEISGDKTYLTQHLPLIESFPRRIYHNDSDAYNHYGMGPGPLGMVWGEMGVGAFMRAAKNAGIHGLPQELPPQLGQYPVVMDRKPSSEMFGLSKTGGAIAIDSGLIGVQGDALRGEAMVTNAGTNKILATVPVTTPGHRIPLSARVDAPAHALLQLRYQGLGGLSQETTGFDAQASVLSTGKTYGSARTYFVMEPVGPAAPLTLAFTALQRLGNDRAVVSVRIRDGSGKVLLEASMHPRFITKQASLTLDPSVHPLPWTVDTMGAVQFTLTSTTQRWVIAPSLQDLRTMKPLLESASVTAPAAAPASK